MLRHLQKQATVSGIVLVVGDFLHDARQNGVVTEVHMLECTFEPGHCRKITDKRSTVQEQMPIPVVDQGAQRQYFLLCGMGLARPRRRQARIDVLSLQEIALELCDGVLCQGLVGVKSEKVQQRLTPSKQSACPQGFTPAD